MADPYQALYRRYRSKRFGELLGCESGRCFGPHPGHGVLAKRKQKRCALLPLVGESLGEGLPEQEAVKRANLYAGLSTTGVGTQKSFYDRSRFDAEWNGRGKA